MSRKREICWDSKNFEAWGKINNKNYLERAFERLWKCLFPQFLRKTRPESFQKTFLSFLKKLKALFKHSVFCRAFKSSADISKKLLS